MKSHNHVAQMKHVFTLMDSNYYILQSTIEQLKLAKAKIDKLIELIESKQEKN